jgi:hypothetical protein
MKHRAKVSVAPITGLGMMAKTADSLGKNASTIRIIPVAKATALLVTPVAMERPILDEDVD